MKMLYFLMPTYTAQRGFTSNYCRQVAFFCNYLLSFGQNKKSLISVFFCFFMVLLSVLSGCSPTYRFEYHYSPDKQYVLTRMDIDNVTYLTYGYYYKKEVPPSYLYHKTKLMLDGWECLLTWDNEKAIIIDPYYYFKAINVDTLLLSNRKLHDQDFYKIYFDTLETKYQRIESFNE